MKNSKTMYILCTNISPQNSISGFRFVLKEDIPSHCKNAIKIEIPTNITLNKCVGTNFYTTENSKTFSEFNYELVSL